MNTVVLFNEPLVQQDGLFSLNQLHKLSGNASKHRPSLFIANAQIQELIAEISLSRNSCLAVQSIKGGTSPGTYACKELVYAYAMWISAKFHLQVIRAFDALVNPQPQFKLPKTHAEALRMLADTTEELEETKQQLTHAVRTKGQISSSREASVMAQLGHAQAQITKLQAKISDTENWKAVTGIEWLGDCFHLCPKVYQVMGKHLTAISARVGLKVIKRPDAKYVHVNVYNVDAINQLKERLDEPSFLSLHCSSIRNYAK